MKIKLKNIFGLKSGFDKLVTEVRQNNCENWKEKFDGFKATNPKSVADKKLSKIGLEIYETIFKKVIADLKVTSEEKQALNEIVGYFNLSQSDVNEVKAKYSRDAVQKLSLEKYSDTILTDDERAEIELFAGELNISEAEVEKINKSVAQNIYKEAVQKAIADKQVTIDEQDTLEGLAKKLGLESVELALDKSTDETYNYLVFLNALNNGYLPTKSNSAIVLQRNELAHWEVPANLLISKTVTTGYTGGSRGVSIRVMKGVSYRVGASRSTPIREQISIKHPGVLVITSKRVVFCSPTKSFSIPYTQLISFDPYSDGLGLQKGNSSYLLSLANNRSAEVTFKMLTNAINKTYD
jgi:tellurite resistance protein